MIHSLLLLAATLHTAEIRTTKKEGAATVLTGIVEKITKIEEITGDVTRTTYTATLKIIKIEKGLNSDTTTIQFHWFHISKHPPLFTGARGFNYQIKQNDHIRVYLDNKKSPYVIYNPEGIEKLK